MTSPSRQEILLLEQHKKLSLHYLSGHGLEWYASIASKPIIYLATLNFAFYLLGGLPNMSQVYEQVFQPLIFLVEITVYAWVGWKVAWKASWKTLPQSMKFFSALFAGGVTGLGLGIIMALFKIFWWAEIWTIFNIITEPPIRLLEGLFITGLSGIITLVFVNWQRHKGKYQTDKN